MASLSNQLDTRTLCVCFSITVIASGHLAYPANTLSNEESSHLLHGVSIIALHPAHGLYKFSVVPLDPMNYVLYEYSLQEVTGNL